MSGSRQEIGDPSLRRGLEKMIRARVPSSEVDDIVQATLTDALASQSVPEDREEVRRWVFGIARHKVADFYRRNGRERPGNLPDIHAPAAPHGAEDLLRWVEKEMPDDSQGKETLDWMLREGEGDKLEHIAEEDDVPAPRVRQRVSRWRKQLRERWAAELAAVAAILVVIGAAAYVWRHRTQDIVGVGPDNSSVPSVQSARLRAAELRNESLQRCERKEWVPCLQGLDEAARLDPAGDQREDVVRARQGASDAMRAPQIDSAPVPVPSSTAPAIPSSDLPTKTAPVPTELPPSPKTTDFKKPGPYDSVNKADSKDSPKNANNYLTPEPQKEAVPQQQSPRVTDPQPSPTEQPSPKQKASPKKASKSDYFESGK